MLVRRMLEHMPVLKHVLWVSLVYAFGIEILKLIPPYLLKLVIDHLLVPDPGFNVLWGLLAGVFFASAFVTFLEARFMLYSISNSFGMEVSLLERLHKKLMCLDISFHESHPSGEIEHIVKQGARQFRELVWFFQERFLGAFLQIILTCGVLLSIDYGSGLIYLVFMPMVIWLVHQGSVRLQPYRKKYHAAFKQASWTLSQGLRNVRTVKDFVQEDTESTTFKKQLSEYKHLADQRMSFERSGAWGQDTVLNLARVSLISYAVYRVHTGYISAGTLVLFITLSEKVVASLFRLGRLYDYLGDARMIVGQMLDLFAYEPKIVNLNDQVVTPKLQGGIRLRRVCFGYSAHENPVLKDIDLYVPARSTVALVGRSGAGKTTLIKLLLRHYDVTGGVLEVDDTDIKNFKVAEYRRNIAVVSQDVEIFDRTIHENICYGLPDVDEETVIQAAKSAYAHDFIRDLPDGYDTRVGERGFKLSGGQRQRIGIARALLLKPAILIFDEATSSLDSESEQLIQQALSQLGQQHTLVIVAHRLSTIRGADQVVVLEDGRIIESGTHEALMKQQGAFSHMQALQSEGMLRA